ncbi:MAG: hypothetical protein IJA67_12650, partial [Oscillospiraceae bacterium]|nr:hypothetical protein [Oscillospiraceae bacterium]
SHPDHRKGNNMKRFFLILMAALLLSLWGCKQEEAPAVTPTPTPTPPVTAAPVERPTPTVEPTGTPEPTPTAEPSTSPAPTVQAPLATPALELKDNQTPFG